MNAEVKLGYKRTEIGVIPEDWCIKPLAELCSFENGDRGKNYPSPGSFVSSGIPFINAGHISNGNIDLRQMDYITPERFNKLGGGKVRNGDILFCLRGSLGKFGVITSAITCGAIASSLVIVRPKSSSITQEYLSSYFSSELCASMIEIWAGGAAQPNLGAQDLAKFLMAIPQCQSEQKKITSVLADTDALICSLDLLIAKKRDIHQATMQQLLTGQRRLPGFSGEWVTKSLMEIAESKKALFDDGDWVEAEHITDQGVRLIQTGNIGVGCFVEKTNRKYIYEESFESLKCKELKVGDILICRLAEPAGRACIFPDIGENKVIASVDVTIFRPRPEVANRNFLVQMFSTGGWFKSVLDQVGGTTHKRISRGALGRIKISLPHIDEQTAIATILSDMDAELAALEARRDKARQLKQGIMQELLTGRIRLLNGTDATKGEMVP